MKKFIYLFICSNLLDHINRLCESFIDYIKLILVLFSAVY
jgi:hypothetical protein